VEFVDRLPHAEPNATHHLLQLTIALAARLEVHAIVR